MTIVISFLLRCITFVLLQNGRFHNFWSNFFFAWTLATSVTSRGRNFNLNNLNRVSNFSWICQLSYEILFVGLEWKWGGFRLCFPKWVAARGPMYLTGQCSLGLKEMLNKMEKCMGDKMAKLFQDNFSMSKIELIFLKIIFFEEYWIRTANFRTALFCKMGPFFVT